VPCSILPCSHPLGSPLSSSHQPGHRRHQLIGELPGRSSEALPTVQCLAWSSSRPTATLSRALWMGETWVTMSMQ
jgi:hypothetical protein